MIKPIKDLESTEFIIQSSYALTIGLLLPSMIMSLILFLNFKPLALLPCVGIALLKITFFKKQAGLNYGLKIAGFIFSSYSILLVISMVGTTMQRLKG